MVPKPSYYCDLADHYTLLQHIHSGAHNIDRRLESPEQSLEQSFYTLYQI